MAKAEQARRYAFDEHFAELKRKLKLEDIRKFEWSANKAKKPQTHMPIGDPHSQPGVPNNRFLWAGRLANERGVDTVIDIGDSFSLDSLCRQEEGKKGHEKTRLELELEYGRDAWAEFERGLAGHKVRKLRTLGNHENRIFRLADYNPVLEGSIEPDFGSAEMGWLEAPYGTPVTINGITYVHIPLSAGTGKPIAETSDNPCIAIRNRLKGDGSYAFGHTHRFGYLEGVNASGKRVITVNLPGYFEQTMGYSGFLGNAAIRRGMCIFNNVVDGDFDLEFMRLERIQEKYKD